MNTSAALTIIMPFIAAAIIVATFLIARFAESKKKGREEESIKKDVINMVDCEIKGRHSKEVLTVYGDVLEVYFLLKNIEQYVIKKVFFTCSSLDLCIECIYSNFYKGYCLRLNSNVAQLLKPKITSYDLTIELLDGNIVTVLQNKPFIILKKKNALCEAREGEDDGIEQLST